MRRYEEIEKDLKVGDKIKCIQMVSNNKEELGYDIMVLDESEEKEAEKILNDCNKRNQDKNYKFIYVEYTVFEDRLECI